MRITITTAQELGAVMCMASNKQGMQLEDLAAFSRIKLLFVVDAEQQVADISFDSMIEILRKQGCRLTVEVPLPKKNKKTMGNGGRGKRCLP